MTVDQPGVLLVTGGSRGIGAATARSAARAGWWVCLTYRDDEAAALGVVADVEATGGRASAVRARMTQEGDIVDAFRAADRMGRLGGFVANAGMVGPRTRVDELTAARVAEMLAVNVTAPVLGCREAVRRMSTRHGGTGGAIVLVSSVAARLGAPGEYVDYAASKGALDTLGTGLAREVAAERVRVNVVRPGIIDTDLHASGGQPDRAARLASHIPLPRPGQPEEVAAAIVWLLSPQASYCTGAVLDVAGGR